MRLIRHEWLSTLCYSLALASVLAPLLVLFGLKHGVVSEMERRLLQNPTNLEINPLVTQTLSTDFLENLARRPGVAFMVPRTRPLSLTVYMESKAGQTVTSDLEPTGTDDPLLHPGTIPDEDHPGIVLSAPLAQILGYARGEEVAVIFTRSQDGFSEVEKVRLPVLDILLPEKSSRTVGFVSQSLVADIEDYRDGYKVRERGWDGPRGFRDGKRSYSGFRLYAQDLEALPDLVRWLQDQGVRTFSSVEDVVGLRLLDRSLGIVFLIILGIGSTGVLIALASNLWAHVDRRRKDLSVIRLMGAKSIVLVCIPILESVVIASLGLVIAAVGYLTCDLILEFVFRAPGLNARDLCKLDPLHWMITILVTILFSITASLVAAARSLSIPPAEGFD